MQIEQFICKCHQMLAQWLLKAEKIPKPEIFLCPWFQGKVEKDSSGEELMIHQRNLSDIKCLIVRNYDDTSTSKRCAPLTRRKYLSCRQRRRL